MKVRVKTSNNGPATLYVLNSKACYGTLHQIKIMMDSQVKVMRKQGKLREGTAEWGAIIHK